MKEEPLTASEAKAFVDAVFRSLGIHREWFDSDPIDAEFVLDDVLDAEEIDG